MALGAVPLLWLAWLRTKGKRREAGYWWIALAFAVSFVADAVTLVAPHRYVAQVYPLLQAGIVMTVLLPRRWAEVAIALSIAAAAASVSARDGAGHDVLLRVVAFGTVAGVSLWRLRPGALHSALVTYFGVGALAWCALLWRGGRVGVP
jgi:hypothetical protein